MPGSHADSGLALGDRGHRALGAVWPTGQSLVVTTKGHLNLNLPRLVISFLDICRDGLVWSQISKAPVSHVCLGEIQYKD